MNDKIGKPSHLVAFGVFVMALGGFFAVLHVGMNEIRGGDRIQHGFGSRVAPERTDYAEALRRGGKAVAASARNFLADTFVGSSRPVRAASRPAYQPQAYSRPPAEEKEFDPLEDFYDKHYGSGRGSASLGSIGAPASWSGSGGSVTAGRQETAAGPAPAARAQKPGLSLQAAAENVPGKPLFGGPAARSAPQRPQLQASLPQGRVALSGLERAGEMTGGSLSRGPGPGGGGSFSGGALSGMRGQGSAANLNGADESASASSAGGYNAKMSGGAAAAAASGAAPPAASAPAQAAGSGGSPGGSGSGAGPAPAADKKDAGGEKSLSQDSDGTRAAPEEESKPFLEVVVVEKRNGRDQKFITEEDAKAAPDEAQLKTGAAAPDERPKEREFRPDGKREERPPDPEKFEELSPERKLELKRRVHGFLKRVETRYGVMDDIFYTPCAAGREICEEHGLTEGYLTLETRDSAELHLGLKYIKDRWRRYTVGFTLPGMNHDWRHNASRPGRPHSEEGSR